MASKGALVKMSYSKLLELRKSIDEAIEHRRSQERQELNDRLSKIAKLIGGDVKASSPMPVRSKRVSPIKGKKVKPKYRNQKNRKETWTGRGRQPRWLAHEIAAGKTIESFLIK